MNGNPWFLAIHLVTQAKTGLSALALKRQIGGGDEQEVAVVEAERGNMDEAALDRSASRQVVRLAGPKRTEQFV